MKQVLSWSIIYNIQIRIDTAKWETPPNGNVTCDSKYIIYTFIYIYTINSLI